MSTHKSLGKRLAAALGAAAIGLVGVAGVATAADSAPGQDGAPTQGTLTIHKFAGTTTDQVNDGSELDPAPDRPPLAGVEFTVRDVTAIGGEAVDLTKPAGWDVVAKHTDAVPAESDLAFGTTNETLTTRADGSIDATLPIGLYYVTETAAGPNDITTPAAPFLVTVPQPQGDKGWLYDVHVYPKNVVSNEPTKTVDDKAAHKLGDKVSWTVTSPALSVQAGSSLSVFEVTDKLVDQLNFVSGSVKASVVSGTTSSPVNDADFQNYFSVDYSPEAPGGTLKISATEAGLTYLNSLPTSDKLSFTFETTVVGVGDLKNMALVNVGGTTTETNEVNTPWGPALIKKHDSKTSAKLAGAEFSVYAAGENGSRPAAGATPILTQVKTGANGEVKIDGLKAGQYWVQETQAPAGYTLPEGDNAWFGPITVAAGTTITDAATVDVANVQQDVPKLPLTGANGELLMTIGGAALVLLAGGTALVARKRSHKG